MMSIAKDLKMFEKLGIRMPKYAIVDLGLRKPPFRANKYVVKAYGKRIVHKTDLKAIKLGVDADLVNVEMRRMKNRLGSKVSKFLVQEQVPNGVEVIIGAKRDEVFGDIVLFGMGGIYVELYKDVAIRLCPVSYNDAIDMINETKAAEIFEGFRGKPRISKSLVAGIIRKVCAVMHKNEDIKEIDLNPVILYPDSYYAVDIRVVR